MFWKAPKQETLLFKGLIEVLVAKIRPFCSHTFKK